MNRLMLTREQYDRIRAVLDARVRAGLAEWAGDPAKCKGCDGDLERYTTGCKTCWDRLRRRKRRQDPVKHAHDLRVWRETRRRRIAKTREAA